MFDITINKETNGCTINGFSSGVHAPEELIIPKKVDGHRVEKIAERAFARRFFKKVDILAEVDVISANTFLSCPKLEMCCLPSNIKEIQKRSFYGCRSLKLIAFSKSTQLDKISRAAFGCCSHLNSLINLRSCRTVGDEAFYSCANFKCITFTFEEAGTRAFFGTGIDSLFVTDKVKKIGTDCFACCGSLKSITFDRSSPFDRISNRAFFSCASLEDVFSAGRSSLVNQIGDSAFEECFNLHQFNLVPQNVIGDYAFRGCSRLKEINVSDKIKRIGKHIPCDVEFI